MAKPRTTTIAYKALRPGAIAPAQKTVGAAGADLCYAGERPVTVRPNVSTPVHTGLAVEIPDGLFGFLLGRSGLAADGLFFHPGIIDSDYRGELICIAFTVNRPKVIRPGDRVAQLVIAGTVSVDFVEAEELSETERGARGLGSTGR